MLGLDVDYNLIHSLREVGRRGWTRMAVHAGSIFVTRSDSVLAMWNVMIPLDDVLLFVSAGPLSPRGKWSETIS